MTNTQAPLDQPLYGASFGQAVSRYFRKGLTFSGRASRSEFWWAFLLYVLSFLVGGVLLAVLHNLSRDPAADPRDISVGGGIMAAVLTVWFLIIIIPTIALHVRRLHDVNLPGPLYLITLIPWLGSLILLIITLLPSNPAGARFDKPAAG